jgi:hypothetical protein
VLAKAAERVLSVVEDSHAPDQTFVFGCDPDATLVGESAAAVSVADTAIGKPRVLAEWFDAP